MHVHVNTAPSTERQARWSQRVFEIVSAPYTGTPHKAGEFPASSARGFSLLLLDASSGELFSAAAERVRVCLAFERARRCPVCAGETDAAFRQAPSS